VAAWVREMHQRGQSGPSGRRSTTDSSTSSTRSTYPEIAANAGFILINVATALLDRQIASQAAAFENEGGFTERLYRVRSSRRGSKSTFTVPQKKQNHKTHEPR
jgi:four helix bundle suffix protein